MLILQMFLKAFSTVTKALHEWSDKRRSQTRMSHNEHLLSLSLPFLVVPCIALRGDYGGGNRSGGGEHRGQNSRSSRIVGVPFRVFLSGYKQTLAKKPNKAKENGRILLARPGKRKKAYDVRIMTWNILSS